MLTQEQVKKIKEQLSEQIESSFPEDRKEFALSQIESMDSKQLEEFLIKNGLMKNQGSIQENSGQCVFCSIVFGDISSYKIAENSKAIAVLEINPISRGHVLVIPKEHITSKKDISKDIIALTKDVSSILKKRLKPETVKISSSNILGHEIFNILPFYKDQKNSSERKQATTAELSELQEMLTKKSLEIKPKEKIKIHKEKSRASEERLWLPKRIP